MNLLIVDIQPAYHYWCEELLPNLRQLLETTQESDKICALWVGKSQSPDTLNLVKTYWLSAGIPAKLLERIQFVEKGFGFFRQWMINAVKDRELVTAAKALREAELESSRHLDTNYIAEVAPSAAWLLPTTAIRLPAELEAAEFLAEGPWLTCGGGRDECLKEVELWLQTRDVSFERLSHLTY